jgi:RHS repeat-associated protein
LQTHYTYEPFGGASRAGTLSANTQQFTGRENDAAGLYFYRARFYSPTLQRFISEDPVGLLAGVNLFAYVLNAPTGFSDPIGLDRRGTVQVGFGGSACAFSVCVSTSLGVAVDANGGVGLFGTSGGGAGVGASASAGLQFGFSNASDVTGLGGPFAQIGGGGGAGAAGGIDYFAGQSSSGYVQGGTVILGAGGGASASAAILAYVSLALWVIAGGLWYSYDRSRPSERRPETGAVFELNTHGHVVYITLAEAVRLYGLMAIGLGGLVLCIAFGQRRSSR